jgi:hypothetical protein
LIFGDAAGCLDRPHWRGSIHRPVLANDILQDKGAGELAGRFHLAAEAGLFLANQL